MYFILRYTGNAAPNADKVQKILKDNHIDIVDKTGLPKMLLVKESVFSVLEKVRTKLPAGWFFSAHKGDFVRVPNTRRKINKKF